MVGKIDRTEPLKISFFTLSAVTRGAGKDLHREARILLKGRPREGRGR